MGAPELIALVLSGALLLYILSGGADFGAGIWDLFARGPRAHAQRRLVEGALAPVWEANHVWLIVAVVVLFTAFPPAFAALTIRLHVPLVALLIGVVLRGSALVFRQYGGPDSAHRWQHVFAVASAATPFFLGAVLGAVTSGAASERDLLAWIAPLPIATGAAATALCAYLAAVYLAVEASSKIGGASGETDPEAPTRELADDFRRRAIAGWIALAVTCAGCAVAAHLDAPRFAGRLFTAAWSAPLGAVAAAAAVAALVALVRGRFRLARVLAIVQASALLAAWGVAHAPLLIAPDLTVRGAAAPPVTLRILGPVLVGGALVVLPSLYWLMRVFKAPPPRPGDPRSGSPT
ncbi:MAG TPA: cytochrome d ubiquinol oxidase subunit II [Kofleriaceae bacterium]|nr:cytochrome d ubiquinol oxidase subunit II [Kofleriaceae bacterium]